MKKWDETIILVRTGVVVFFSEKRDVLLYGFDMIR